MKLAVVKYNSGNVESVLNTLHRIGIEPVLTDNPDELKSADKILFPGVGQAASAMAYLREKNLDSVLRSLTQPFLGICFGMQLMCNHSEEGDVDCLGIFDVAVKKFPPLGKVPHMGWNTISDFKSPLLTGIPENEYMYFVHSYYAELCTETSAKCDYLLPFSAGLQKDNFHAFQFHPEKSGLIGEQIIKNFVEF
jgi:glutamine amidotransferase